MDTRKISTIVQNVYLLIEQFATNLPSRNIVDARELLEHDEWGEAFDLICTQLDEYDLSVSQEQFDLIDQTGRMMEINPSEWKHLRESIVMDPKSEHQP